MAPREALARRQADRRAHSRDALLTSAAQRLSRHGYANLVLERVAADAGFTRGALYHQFAGKDELVLAVVDWVQQEWDASVRAPAAAEAEPAAVLVGIARHHAIFCRRDVARVMLVLRTELGDHDHPVGRAVAQVVQRLSEECADLITAARATGALPPGAPADVLADAYLAVVEAVGIELAGREPYDVDLAERAVRGLLGLPPAPPPTDPQPEERP